MRYTRYCLSLLLALSALSLSACASFGLPVSGHVLEQGTNKPIPDAIVVVRWEGSIPWSQTACVHVETAMTDKDGYFQTHAWHGSSHRTGAIVTGIHTDPWAYAQNYEPAAWDGSVIYLRRFTGNRSERPKQLVKMLDAIDCDSGGISRRNLYLPFSAMYYEAKAIATTADAQRQVTVIRREAAEAGVATDNDMSTRQLEIDRRAEEFLQDHLK